MSATVLIVADDTLFLQNLSGIVTRLKASLVTAGSKQEALEICALRPIDLALLDIRQHGKDAMQVLARLKHVQPETEVILLSDLDNIALVMEGMRQGASDDLTVPFDIAALRRKIVQALQRRKSRLKAGRQRMLMDAFQGTMAAATFAEAGEFEIARDLAENGAPDLLAVEKHITS
jgi:DNA-binding NtrC family response regulator